MMGFGLLSRSTIVAFALLALRLAGWYGWLLYLTAANGRACGEATSEPKESAGSARSGELRRVLDRYSAKNEGVGLQATVVFPDGKVWSGTSGYANHGKRCRLTLDRHLYIGSMTKLYTPRH
jgi:CubicO group peptidase (beta-lactamase class C family)